MSKNTELTEKRVDFLIEAYKLRAQLYGDLTNRMWSRFNYLLAASVALFGIFFNIWFTIQARNGVFWFPVAGIIISAVWFILGAQDRYYFEGFRIQVRQVEEEISNELKITNLKGREFASVKDVQTDWVTWRWSFGSLSRLPALVPILFALMWSALLVVVRMTK
jgi:hypothetical protein